MICQLCSERPANILINIVVNGKLKTLCICNKCAHENKIQEDPTGQTVLKLYNEVQQKAAQKNEKTETKATEQVKCPACGTNEMDFAKSPLLGCEKCYKVFAEQLQPILKKRTKPSAEAQLKTMWIKQKKKEIEKLELLLKEAIAREDYENAAKFRDKITELKNEMTLPPANLCEETKNE